MIGLIAQKSEMTQLALDSGEVVGVTWLIVHPNTVAQVKTPLKEGYAAVQLAAGKSRRLTHPLAGHLKTISGKFLRELKITDPGQYQVGDKVDVSVFQVGDRVQVTAVSKGKGFAGTIKRHHFKSGPGSHGHDHHRQPGSIGAMGIARVLPGRRMAGHLGSKKITTKNLEVVAVDATQERLALKGAVPGYNRSFVLVQKYA